MNNIDFSEEQKVAFDKYIQGENVFITGPGGCGKSLLIKYIKQYAETQNKKIQVCAMTGCAALLLACKAKTIHSWSGINLGNGSISQNVNKIVNNMIKRTIWEKIDILIIDEVSMMSKKIFEMLDAIGKKVRKNTKPFGGIQLIFSGDFFQLPPVGNKEEIETIQFCFESDLWKNTFSKNNHVELKKIFRQKDEVYCNILNEIREGKLKKSNYNKLMDIVNKTNIKKDDETGSIPTKLYPVRYKVDTINNISINKLVGEEKVFKSKWNIDIPISEKEYKAKFSPERIKAEMEHMENNLLCEKSLRLKVGAQVMSISNIEFSNGFTVCNGSQGIVTKFTDEGFPIIKFNSGFEVIMNLHTWPSENIPGIGITQIPLILSWAITIHKSQGASLDYAEIDAGRSIFECGQTYVALSRVKSLEGLYLTSFDVNKIRINKKVREFYDDLRK
jgi:ATP-dependent DNA helicase PIF1